MASPSTPGTLPRLSEDPPFPAGLPPRSTFGAASGLAFPSLHPTTTAASPTSHMGTSKATLTTNCPSLSRQLLLGLFSLLHSYSSFCITLVKTHDHYWASLISITADNSDNYRPVSFALFRCVGQSLAHHILCDPLPMTRMLSNRALGSGHLKCERQ